MIYKNITKDDIAKSISSHTGYSKNFSKKLTNDIINSLIFCIASGDFNLKNIGSFKIKDKKERIGRNPKTKKEYLISARKSISFKPSKKFDNIL